MILKKERTGQVVRLPLCGKFLIGQSSQCDVSITDPSVSEFQAFIEITKVDGLQEYKIHHMRQGEGSTLLSGGDEYGDAGKWHDVTRPVVLTGGNRLRFGKSEEIFIFCDASESKAQDESFAGSRPHTESMEDYLLDEHAYDPQESDYMRVRTDESVIENKLVKFEEIRMRIQELSWLNGTQLMLLYKHTVLEYVSTEPLYHITVFIYLLTRLLVYFEICDSDEKFLNPAGVISTVLSFLFVFFVSNAYAMYRSSYDAAMTVHGTIQNMAVCLRTGLTRPAALKVLRLLNAAHYAAYVGLTKEYTVDNFFIPSVKKFSLLTEEELQFLLTLDIDSTGGHGFKTVVAWISDVLHNENKHNRVDRAEFRLLLELLQKMRGNLAQLYDNRDFSVPFIYVHFVYFCTAMYLPLSAYALGRAGLRRTSPASLQYELFAFIALLFKCIFFLGLYRLSRSFQNAFELNSSCFSCKQICEETFHHSFRICNVKAPSHVAASSEVEFALHSRRPVLGTGRYANHSARNTVEATPSARINPLHVDMNVTDALPRPSPADDKTKLI